MHLIKPLRQMIFCDDEGNEVVFADGVSGRISIHILLAEPERDYSISFDEGELERIRKFLDAN